MRAISTLRRDDGISTRTWRASVALRIRVSMSEIGSVISLELFSLQSSVFGLESPVSIISLSRYRLPIDDRRLSTELPAALRHAGDIAFERQLAEAQPAQG